MLSNKSIYTAALLAYQLVVQEADARREPWNCYEIELATEPFYRMFPASLGRLRMEDEKGFNIGGRCFSNIEMSSEFEEDDEGALKVKVIFDLQDSYGLCAESLQISTAFSDYYNFYVV